MTHPYSLHVKPRLGKLLAALGVDMSFERAEGDSLYWRDEHGREHAVLDLIGGHGALLFGHNHPRLVQTAQALLAERVPMHAQLSLRRRAGELGARLAAMAAAETGGQWKFMSLFTHSGDEAVQAAVKHAELERVQALQALLDDIAFNIETVRTALRRGEATIPADIYEFASVREKAFDVRGFDDLIVGLLDHNAAQLFKRPVFLALEGSSHAALAGSVHLTGNTSLRRPFQYLGLKLRFVPPGNVEALERIAADERLDLYDLGLENGRVVLRMRAVPIFTAFLVEPLQGQGNLQELDAEFARAIRRFCNQHQMPLIVDETDSGLGRCGGLFAASHIGLKGDYYALGDALGGGLARIAALLVREERYQPDFGLLHGVGQAEDDFACGIALQVLEMLQAEDAAACRRAAHMGQALRERLQALGQRYPGVIRGVRGRGLLLGVELAPQSQASSQIFRSADEAELLGHLLAGYLLRTTGLRVSPTPGNPRVLRLQPSLLLEQPGMQRIESALERVCAMLERQDAMHVVFALADARRPIPREDIRDFREAPPPPRRPILDKPTRPVRKVAFITHLIGPEWVRKSEPSLSELSDEELRAFVLKMAVAKKSAPLAPVRVQSPLGPVVDLLLYPMFVMSEQMWQWLSSGDLAGIRGDIETLVRAARDDGCELAGLGMYNASVTNNCTAVKVPEIGLTSGNALTVALSLEALERAVEARGLRWDALTLAVVGATGNIAATYAAMFAERAQRLLLIGAGRDGSLQRVRSTMFAVYEECWQMLRAGHGGSGIAARLAQEPLIAQWLEHGAPAQHRGRLIHEALAARHGHDPFIRISQDPLDVRDADVVLCRASAAEPLLDAADFREGAVVCDVAVPRNVSAHTLAQRPGLDYMLGGIVATPNGESLPHSVRAFLGDGQLFACMAETVILGLAGMSGHYSYGDISRRQVREIAALAATHGFKLADFKRFSSL